MREKTRYCTIAGTWGALLIVTTMFYSQPVLAQTGVPRLVSVAKLVDFERGQVSCADFIGIIVLPRR
jgi:hypothetical protein